MEDTEPLVYIMGDLLECNNGI